jgi:hypothetical protein
MALPVTISSSAFPAQNYFCGPFKAPNQQYYLVLLESTGSTPEVFMATDPTSSFAAQDASNNPTATPESMWAYLSGSEIHIATASADGNDPEIQYHVFDTASDTWATTDEEIEDTKGVAAGFESCSIAVRSDGDVIVLYNGSIDTDMGNPFERVDYARKEASSWTVGIDVGGTSPEDEDRVGSVITRGSGDNMHFFWRNVDLSRQQGRTLDPGTNVLSLTRWVSISGAPLHSFVNGISYDDAGTLRIVTFHKNVNTRRVTILTATEDGSGDISSFTFGGVNDAPANGVLDLNGTPVISSAVDGDGRVYAMWSHETDFDLYMDSDTPPYDTVDWGTDIEVLDGVTINRISCNVYSRESTDRLAYVYDDGGTIKYNEVDLGGGAGQVDLTHLTDSLLKKQQELTHLTDSLLKKQQELTHLTDSLLKKQQELEHLTDSLLKAEGQRTHLTDSLLKKQQELAHSTDSFFKLVIELTHSTDSLLKAEVDKAHLTDSLLKKQQELTHSTDSLKKKQQALVHSTDSLLAFVVELTHLTDSLLKGEIDKIHTTDSFLIEDFKELTHSTDSLLKKAIELTHSTDSFLRFFQDLVHSSDSLLVGNTANVSGAFLEIPDIVRHGIITWAAFEVPRIPGETENLFNRIKDFNEGLLLEELDAVGLKPSELLFAGFDPDFSEPDRRIWTPSSEEKESYGTLAQPGDLRFTYPFTLTGEDVIAIDAVLDAHSSGNTTSEQDSEDQDDSDLDVLRTYFDKPCPTLSVAEHDDAVCRLLRLMLRFHRGDPI